MTKDILTPEEKKTLHNNYLLHVMQNPQMSMEQYCKKLLRDMNLLKDENVYCAVCGATKTGEDWDIAGVQDPCSPGCHMAESDSNDPELENIGNEMSRIDAVIEGVRQTGSFQRGLKVAAEITGKPRLDGEDDGEDDSKSYLFDRGDR